MTTITVGCDPEIFVQQGGKNVSAHGLIPGTKEAPHKVRYGAVQVDGMALEFNIDPASSPDLFRRNIRRVMEQLAAMLPEHDFAINPIAHFDPEYMRSQPEEALELGCEADYNAYTGQANDRPNGDVPYRTAGGHVHIGWGQDLPVDHPDHVEACQMICRELDFMLGLPSLFWDEDDERRSLYGAPGAFRPKSYGVEYRSLSNAWLRDERLQDFVFAQVNRAYARLVEGQSFYEDYHSLAKVLIEENDRETAKEVLKHIPQILGEEGKFLIEG